MPIKINGATSGSTTITAPATGSDETIELSTALASKLDLAGGKILQVVRATDSTGRQTSSTSFVDVTGMSVTITPQKSDSAVLIFAVFRAGIVGNYYGRFAIADSSNNAISGAEECIITGNVGGDRGAATLWAYATPATTSAVSYKLRFLNDNASGVTLCENNTQTGQMYAIEVSA